MKAAEGVSKHFLETKQKLEKRGVEPNRQTSRAGTNNFSSTGPAIVVKDDGPSEDTHIQASGSHGNLKDPVENFKMVSVARESLVDGILNKYYDQNFMDKLDRMDRIQKKQTFSHLLTVLQKIDGLLSGNCFSYLDINMIASLNKVIEDAVALLSASHVTLYQVDNETGEISALGSEKESLIRFPAGHGIVGLAALSGDLLNVRDPATADKYEAEIDCHCEQAPMSILAIPLFSGEQKVIGVLLAENKLNEEGQPTYFDEEDEFLFKILGNCAGSVLSNSKLYEAMAVTQKNIEVLLSTTRSLGSILQLDKLIKVIMDSAKELLNADRCALFLDDPGRKKLNAIIQGRDSVQTISIPYTAGIAGAAFTSGSPINIHDAYKDSRFNPEVDRQTGYVTRTMLCMPIKNIHGECIGVTQMINKRKGVFSASDEMILSSFSVQGKWVL